jgi:hypothetical protein
MSNRCYNKFIVIGDEYVLDYLENIQLDFETIHPVPKELRNMENNEKACEWMSANWGVYRWLDEMKTERVSDTVLFAEINTAWKPPLEILQYVTSKFNVEIILDFEDPMAFAGIVSIRNGEIEEYRKEVTELHQCRGGINGRYETVEDMKKDVEEGNQILKDIKNKTNRVKEISFPSGNII